MNPKNRNLIIGGVAGLLLVCCCCVVAGGALVVVDPFGWGLLAFLPGRGEPISAAIPADAPVYSTMDLTALSSPQVARVIKAFADVPGLQDYAGADNMLEELDKNLQDELGLTVTGDVTPWVGKYAGIAVSEIPQNPDNPGEAPFVIMVEARDKAKAEAFIAKLVEALAQKSGTTPASAAYQGVTVHTVAQASGEPVVVALSKNLVLLSPSESAVQAAIDVQSGAAPSAAKAADYASVRRQLPSNSLLTVVAGGPALRTYLEELQALQGGLTSGLDPTQAGLKAVQSVGLALSVVEEGVRLDSVIVLDEAQLSDTLRQYYAAAGDSQMAKRFPADTLLYLAGQRPDLMWAMFRDAMDPNDFSDAMQAFEGQFGFNPDEALLPYLQGGMSVALVPDADSPLAAEVGDFGYAALLETNNAAALGETLTTLNGTLEQQGMVIEERTVGSETAYVVSAGDQPLAFYGIARDVLTLASSEAVFAGLAGQGQAALADNPDYQKVWRAFPAGMRPAVYANVAGLVDLARQSMPDSTVASFDEQVLPYLQPISAVASGVTPLKNSVVQSTFMVFIEGGQ